MRGRNPLVLKIAGRGHLRRELYESRLAAPNREDRSIHATLFINEVSQGPEDDLRSQAISSPGRGSRGGVRYSYAAFCPAKRWSVSPAFGRLSDAKVVGVIGTSGPVDVGVTGKRGNQRGAGAGAAVGEDVCSRAPKEASGENRGHGPHSRGSLRP